MKKFKRALSVMVAASVMTSLCSCDLGGGKDTDEVLDLAEDVCKYTTDLDYKKLSGMTEDGDDKLEEIFDAVGEDEVLDIIASTLEYEIDEDSFEKDGKKGYTVDVTFTYVDYEKILDIEEPVTLSMFEDMVGDSDDVNEETITLEFEKDDSDIIFVNIDDLEDLFPYWDEDLGVITGGVEDVTVEEDEDDDEPTATTSAAETSETTEPSQTTPSATTAAANTDYPNPADVTVEDVCYLLPDTNIVFNVPTDNNSNTCLMDGIEYDTFLIGGHATGNFDENSYYISTFLSFAYDDEFVLEFRDSRIETEIEYLDDVETYDISDLEMTIGDMHFPGRLATVTRTDGSTYYIYVVMIGSQDETYIVMLESSDLNFISNFGSNFSLV